MNRGSAAEKGMPAMGWRNMGKGWLFLLAISEGAGKTAVWRAMEKMRDGAGRGQRQSDGIRIFLLPGILLCAVPKCIACH